MLVYMEFKVYLCISKKNRHYNMHTDEKTITFYYASRARFLV